MPLFTDPLDLSAALFFKADYYAFIDAYRQWADRPSVDRCLSYREADMDPAIAGELLSNRCFNLNLSVTFPISNEWVAFLNNQSKQWIPQSEAYSITIELRTICLYCGESIDGEGHHFYLSRWNGQGSSLVERTVMTEKDMGKWHFTQSGPIQDFENPDFYSRRPLRTRLSNEILHAYMAANDVPVSVDSGQIGPMHIFRW